VFALRFFKSIDESRHLYHRSSVCTFKKLSRLKIPLSVQKKNLKQHTIKPPDVRPSLLTVQLGRVYIYIYAGKLSTAVFDLYFYFYDILRYDFKSYFRKSDERMCIRPSRSADHVIRDLLASCCAHPGSKKFGSPYTAWRGTTIVFKTVFNTNSTLALRKTNANLLNRIETFPV